MFDVSLERTKQASIGSYLLLMAVLVISIPSTLQAEGGKSFEEWLEFQKWESRRRLFRNISPDGAKKGTVIASPSRSNPNYFFHWVRDAALVMKYVQKTNDDGTHTDVLKHYASFARNNQQSDAPTGLGEPKFHPDGRPYRKPWGRPQNDGPALRALTLIDVAEQLLERGNGEYVRTHLYGGDIPAKTVIKADLEYVAHHWREPSYDLWEEVKGDHFYTRFVQQAALIHGAKLARRLDDAGAAKFYREQANAIRKRIQKHWNEQKGQWDATLDWRDGIDYKSSGLDTSVLLAYLHAPTPDDFGRLDDPKLIATVERLRSRFDRIYAINDREAFPATLIGRYPEDRYFGGNPWVLTTLAFARYHFELASLLQNREQLRITDRTRSFWNRLLRTQTARTDGIAEGVRQLSRSERPRFFEDVIDATMREGEDYLRRIRVHARPDGGLSEQLDRTHGVMLGANDLTWSHKAFLNALIARKKAMK